LLLTITCLFLFSYVLVFISLFLIHYPLSFLGTFLENNFLQKKHIN
jgi:hypothetical protein